MYMIGNICKGRAYAAFLSRSAGGKHILIQHQDREEEEV